MNRADAKACAHPHPPAYRPSSAYALTALAADVPLGFAVRFGKADALPAQHNRLLACLPEAVRQRWQSHLEPIDLPLGKVLCEPGERMTHVVFPTTAIVSMLHITQNGSSTEIAVVGSEGMVGTWLPMGGCSIPSREVVYSAGYGLRLRSSVLLEDFHRSPALMHLVLRYTQALLTQISQAAVCNRHHSLEQRLSHWLLLRLDRLGSRPISTTQELLATMLGVRRESVTGVAGRLQKSRVITCQRGHIEVTDRKGLELQCCECYRVVKQEYERLLPEKITT